ncbi:hypothetical protein V5H98_18125 [Georgenia sp. M64]|uniref:hypothetical protein n=1 Tax=Georgenia sp. M64 TaxID=3120520 RepID=UPI0030E4C4CC
MSERHDAIDRLRAADPARGVEPDLTALRARVDAGRTATPAAAPAEARHDDPARAGSTGGTVVDLAERRRRRGLRLGAAAAGVALLAGAFGLGRTFGAPEGGAPSAAPAISLDRAQSEAASSGGLDASTAIYPAPSSRHTTFRSEGLSDDGGSAVAWAYDATARFGPDQVRELGAAVGLSGEPRQEFGAWVLGPQDGTGPSLSVAPDGMTSVSFYDPTKEPFRCAAVGGGTEPGAVTELAPATEPDASAEPGAAGEDPATSDMVEPLPAESCGPVDLGPAPTGEAARAQAADVLTAAGLDPADFELVDTALGDTTMTEVLAHHVVDGRRTGASWYIMLTGAGVQSFSGPVAPLVELGDYPVIGAASAVERLTDPRFSDLGTLSIMREPDPAAAEGGADDTVTSDIAPDDAFPTEPPAPVTAGQPVPWPVEEVAITGATLGVAQYTTPSGAAMLLPAYALTSDDGRTWSVLAVAEDALDLAS